MSRALLGNAWLRLSLTHLAAVLLGVGAGAAYYGKQSESVERMVRMLESRSQFQAAMLAYRFGPPDHARALLQSLLRRAPESDLEWGDVMLTRVRLAIVDGEHTRDRGPWPQLSAASDACRRFGKQDCSTEQLRGVAAKLAPLR